MRARKMRGRTWWENRKAQKHGPAGRVRKTLRARAYWHGNVEVLQGLNCVAGAAFLQVEVQISWQAQHFRKVKFS